MTTTPEPAVSPAPDTDALRAYLRRTIGGDFERRLIAADLLDDDDELSVLRVFEDVVPAIEREITSRHEAFVLMLADAKSERDERIAGLRADLDRARATIAHLQEEVAKQNNRRAVIQGAYQQVWDTIGPVVRYPINPDSPADTIMFSVPDAAEAIVAEVLELRARSAGARTIPDGAAERKLNQAISILFELVYEDCSLDHHGYCQAHGWMSESECPQARAKRWLSELDLGATPTTGPAPAAVECGRLVRHFGETADMSDSTPWRCRLNRDHHGDCSPLRAMPAAPQAPAQPTDDYGDNLTAGFLRAPVGACSCRPTAAVIHVPGTYCGDTQHEQAVDAMRAKTGRPGDERDEDAVSAVLGYLANPTPEEEQ